MAGALEDSHNGARRGLSLRRLTICVVGMGGVGKSSLTLRYMNGHFPEVSHAGSLFLKIVSMQCLMV